MSERLLRLLQDAARGAPPPADGLVEVWPAPPGAAQPRPWAARWSRPPGT